MVQFLSRQMVLLAVAVSFAVISPPTASPEAGVKPQLRGVVDRNDLASEPYRHIVNGHVVTVGWKDLQLVPAGPLTPRNAIDRALAEVRRLNARDPGLGLRLKLRVLAGWHAPEWAKHVGGPPITICAPESGGTCATVGRFWTGAFGAAYEDLQRRLAARYDNAEEILEVVVSRCTTVFAEPFLRQAGHDANLDQYRNAGYTLAADRQCQRDQIDAHRVWERTRSSVAFNPYQAIDADRFRVDVEFTNSMMEYCRAVLGERCVVGNNSIGKGEDDKPRYATMYAGIRALGPPIYFQTATLARIQNSGGTVDDALLFALDHGAAMVELPGGYQDAVEPGRLAPRDAELEAQPEGSF